MPSSAAPAETQTEQSAPTKNSQVTKSAPATESSSFFRQTMENIVSGKNTAPEVKSSPAPENKEKPGMTLKELGDTVVDTTLPKEKAEPEKQEPKEQPKEEPKGEPASETDKPSKSLREKLRSPKDSPSTEKSGEQTSVPDEELVALPTDPIRVRDRINGLRGKMTQIDNERKKLIDDLNAKNKELAEAKSRLEKVPQDLDARLTEHTQFRRRYQLENDPEFKKKYDDRIADADKTINDTLAQLPEYDHLKDIIEKAGGFGKFGRSGARFQVSGTLAKDPNAKEPEIAKASQLYERMLSRLPAADADVVRGLIGEQVKLERDRKREMDDLVKQSNEYFAKQAEEEKSRTKQRETRLAEVATAADMFAKNSFEKIDFFKDVEIPKNGDAAAIAEAKAENAFRKQLRETFVETIKSPTVQRLVAEATTNEELVDLGNLMLDSVRTFHVERELERAQKKITELEGRIKKMKEASATTARPGAGSHDAQTGDDAKPERMEGESPLAYSIRTGQTAS